MNKVLNVKTIIASLAIMATLAIMVLMPGCKLKNPEPSRDSVRQQQAIDACIHNGGVPIIDSWGNMTDCKFPPHAPEKK